MTLPKKTPRVEEKKSWTTEERRKAGEAKPKEVRKIAEDSGRSKRAVQEQRKEWNRNERRK
jgi:hypothetical protein